MTTTEQQLKEAEQPKDLTLNEPDWFFGQSNFITVFKMEGQWRVKWFRNLDDNEYESAIREANIWRFYRVFREPGIAEVHYDSSAGVDPEHFDDNPEDEIEPEDRVYFDRRSQDTLVKRFQGQHVDAMTEIELVGLTDPRIQRDNLLYFLSQDFNRNGNSNWSRAAIEREYGEKALLHWINSGFLVYSTEGWVKLSHAKEGTVENFLTVRKMSKASVRKMLDYNNHFSVLK